MDNLEQNLYMVNINKKLLSVNKILILLLLLYILIISYKNKK